MTTDELIEHARGLLEHGRAWIGKHGELRQQFHLIHADGRVEVMIIAGGITNSAELKARLSAKLKGLIRSGDVVAVMMLSDVYLSKDGTLETEKARYALGLTLQEGAEAGLGYTVQENVIVLLESPIMAWGASREYRRVGGAIEWVGDVQEMSEGWETSGSLAGYWPRAEGTKQ